MAKTLNILYLDIDAQFLNPTRSLVPIALAGAGNLTCFGPGHVSSDVLARGLSAFIDRTGPYDLAVTNSHVLFADIYQADFANVRRSYVVNFPALDLPQLKVMAREFANLTLPRVAVLFESDYFNWSHREIDALDSRAEVFVAFGAQFFLPKDRLPNLQREAFAHAATDAWADFASAASSRVASMPHFVSDREFAFLPLTLRTHDWSIVGINYFARGAALAALRQAGIKVQKESPVRRGVGLLKRLGLLRRERAIIIDGLNRDFHWRLASSRFSYTCGSGLDMPIRKFFEIPAAGAVLVCRPFSGFADAGFVDGVNCVACQPEHIVQAHRALSSTLDDAQRIASAGRALVFRRHSTAARAQQFGRLFQSIVDGTFAGAGWAVGEFVVNEKIPAAVPAA